MLDTVTEAVPALLSKSAYARHRGVTPAQVTHWKNSGRLVLVGDRVNVPATEALLAETTDHTKGGGRGGNSLSTAMAAAAPVPEPSGPEDGARYGALARATIADREASAEIKRIQLGKASGELCPVDGIRRAMAELIAPALQRLETLPDRVASRIAAAGGDTRKVRTIIAAEIDGIRQEIESGARSVPDKVAG